MIGLVISLLSVPHWAQAETQPYKWKDQRGRIVYSDVPPPPWIPASNIIQRPPLTGAGHRGSAGHPEQAQRDVAKSGPVSDPASGSASGPDTGPLTHQDQAEALRKRMAERKEAEEKASKEAQARATLAEDCKQLQANIAQHESGMRVSILDASGQPKIMDDAERQVRLAESRSRLAKHCSGA